MKIDGKISVRLASQEPQYGGDFVKVGEVGETRKVLRKVGEVVGIVL
jgi:hypothetical protein